MRRGCEPGCGLDPVAYAATAQGLGLGRAGGDEQPASDAGGRRGDRAAAGWPRSGRRNLPPAESRGAPAVGLAAVRHAGGSSFTAAATGRPSRSRRAACTGRCAGLVLVAGLIPVVGRGRARPGRHGVPVGVALHARGPHADNAGARDARADRAGAGRGNADAPGVFTPGASSSRAAGRGTMRFGWCLRRPRRCARGGRRGLASAPARTPTCLPESSLRTVITGPPGAVCHYTGPLQAAAVMTVAQPGGPSHLLSQVRAVSGGFRGVSLTLTEETAEVSDDQFRCSGNGRMGAAFEGQRSLSRPGTRSAPSTAHSAREVIGPLAQQIAEDLLTDENTPIWLHERSSVTRSWHGPGPRPRCSAERRKDRAGRDSRGLRGYG